MTYLSVPGFSRTERKQSPFLFFKSSMLTGNFLSDSVFSNSFICSLYTACMYNSGASACFVLVSCATCSKCWLWGSLYAAQEVSPGRHMLPTASCWPGSAYWLWHTWAAWGPSQAGAQPGQHKCCMLCAPNQPPVFCTAAGTAHVQ